MNNSSELYGMESMFDAEQSTASILEAVRANVCANVKTIDQAAALENKLSEEAARFNECLTTISNSIRKCERGEISRDQMLAECAPCVSALKKECAALSLANIKATGDDITEDEIAMLREVIVGCKDIVAARKKELQDCSCEGGCEGIMSTLSNYSAATEASVASEIRKSTEAKTANELYKQAKKLYGLGSKEKAFDALNKAKKLYEKCLSKAEKEAKMYETKRTVKEGSDGVGYSISDEYKKKVTDDINFSRLITYFEDRIDSCKALEMQWNNKAGKSTYAETKKQLKLERAKIKAGNRARRKAERMAKKTMKNYKPEVSNDREDRAVESALNEVIDACESILNEYALEEAIAMEADGDDRGGDPNTEKLRELAIELKKAQSSGDAASAARISDEMNRLIDTIQKEAEDAYSEEDYAAAKKKAVKTAAIVAGAVAAAGLVAAGVKNRDKFAAAAQSLKERASNLKNKKADASSKNEVKSIFGSAKSLGSSIKNNIRGIFSKGQESYTTVNNMVESLESYMDSLEMELAIEAAMEAEGNDDSGAETASGLGAKIRAAFAKLRKGKKENDSQAIREAQEDIRETAEEISEADSEATTPEEKTKLSKAVKIGLAAGGAAAATVGLIALAKTASKAAADASNKGFEIKRSTALMAKLGDAIASAKSSAKGAVVNTSRQVGEKIERGRERARNKKIASQFNKSAFGSIGDENGKKSRVQESFLSNLAFGLEGVMVDDEDFDDDDIDNMIGKSFDVDSEFEDEADEAYLENMANEAAIAVMMVEDGIDDSDIE